MYSFCQGGEDSALVPFAPRIAQDLGPLILVTSEDTLSLVLEALSVVLEVDQGQWLTPELAGSLVNAALEVWNKNNKGEPRSGSTVATLTDHDLPDPIFISILTDIITNLASSRTSGIYETVVKQALPLLSSTISVSKKEESWIAASAIDLVSSLVKGAPDSGLGDGFFNLLGPNLFSCLTTAEDRDVLQASVILRFFRLMS